MRYGRSARTFQIVRGTCSPHWRPGQRQQVDERHALRVLLAQWQTARSRERDLRRGRAVLSAGRRAGLVKHSPRKAAYRPSASLNHFNTLKRAGSLTSLQRAPGQSKMPARLLSLMEEHADHPTSYELLRHTSAHIILLKETQMPKRSRVCACAILYNI